MSAWCCCIYSNHCSNYSFLNFKFFFLYSSPPTPPQNSIPNRKVTCVKSHMIEFVCLSISYLDYCRQNIVISNKLVSPAGKRHLLLIIPVHIPCADINTDLYSWENILYNNHNHNHLFSIPEIHQRGYRTCQYITTNTVQNVSLKYNTYNNNNSL